MATDAAGTRHPIGTFVQSRRPLVRAARLAVAALLVLVGAVQLVQGPLALLRTPTVYVKDFAQEYTLARATLAGDDPYAPIAELTQRYIGVSMAAIGRELIDAMPPPAPTADTSEFGNHPTPHPPTVALLSVPLALMSFPVAATAWTYFELLCLAATLWLLARADRVPIRPIVLVGATLALVGLAPVYYELMYGQLTLPSLALLAGARLARARGRPGLAGVLLGGAVLLKPTPWVLIALLAAHRQWRLVAASSATIAIAYLGAAAVLGPATILRYFAEVLPLVNRIYATSFFNMSIWSVGSRLFRGTRAIAAVGFDSPPLLDAPALAGLVGALLPALLLLGALIWAWRRPGVDLCFGVGAALSVLLSPISWSFYALLAGIAAWQVVQAIHRRGYPPAETNWLLAAAAVTAINVPVLVEPFVTPTLLANGNLAFSFAAAQLHLAWTVSVLLVAALAAHLGARGLVSAPARPSVGARPGDGRDGGPMPIGTSGSLPLLRRFPRLDGTCAPARQIEGAKLT